MACVYNSAVVREPRQYYLVVKAGWFQVVAHRLRASRVSEESAAAVFLTLVVTSLVVRTWIVLTRFANIAAEPTCSEYIPHIPLVSLG